MTLGDGGYTVVLDALLALIIVLTLFAGFYGTMYIRPPDASSASFKSLHYVSEDALDVLNKKGVLDEIGYAWASASGDNTSGNWSIAANLSSSYLEGLIPPQVGYRFYIEDDVLAENLSRLAEADSVAKTNSVRLLVGYGAGLPSRGDVARTYLTKIKSKTTSAYAFFGGFVGEGNLTHRITLPSDVDSVIQAYVELNAGAGFDLYVNGLDTGCCTPSGSGNMSANVKEYIASPGSYFSSGDNVIRVVYTSGDLEERYAGGGYIRVTYNTSKLQSSQDTGTLAHDIPGIDGLINLYSSFYVPGQLNSMHAHLEFMSNYTTYVTIGNTTVYEHPEGDWSNQTVDLYDDNLSSVLDYGQLSLETIPFRVGTRNLSGQGGLVDVMLVEDRSGSMQQSGWLLKDEGTVLAEYVNVSVPAGGWSSEIEFNVSTGSTTNETIFSVEAEDYDRSEDFQSVADSSASGGYYMWTSEGFGDNWDASSDTAMEYDFAAAEDGDYIVSARIRSQNGDNSDSFWVSIDNGTEYLWDIQPNNGSWGWDEAMNRGGPDPVVWSLESGSHTLRIELREDGTQIDAINITKLVYGKLAAELTWDRITGYNGSEGSELVINLRRPDGTWVFNGGTILPYPDAGGYVDPPSGDAGTSLDFYSGICTKPQTLLVYDPHPGTWAVTVYGWNMRPTAGPPSSMPVNITILVDEANRSDDDILRGETVISYDAALEAAKYFVDNMVPTDRAGYAVFGSYSSLTQELTLNHDDVKTAIDNTGLEGGTAIHTGIDEARQELVNNGRPDANLVMIVLTDGQNDAGPDPVTAAAQTAKDAGIRVFTIGLTAFVNQEMLEQAASSPSDYYYAPTGSDLLGIYSQITQQINVSYHGQQVNVSGDFMPSILYPGSFFEFNYTPQNGSGYGEIDFTYESERFNDTVNCVFPFLLPGNTGLSEAYLTSYSSNYWSDYASVNGSTAYSLRDSHFGSDYSILGDPYIVYLQPGLFGAGANNTIVLETGLDPITPTGCSADNRLIYTLRLDRFVGYGNVFAQSLGCDWAIEFEDGSSIHSPIPSDYNGSQDCYYTGVNSSGAYPANDAYSDAIARLLRQLDADADGRVDVVFDETMVEFDAARAGGVPSLWGPIKAKLVLWM